MTDQTRVYVTTCSLEISLKTQTESDSDQAGLEDPFVSSLRISDLRLDFLIPRIPYSLEQQGSLHSTEGINDTSPLSSIIFFIPTLFLNIPYPYPSRALTDRSGPLFHSRRLSSILGNSFVFNLLFLCRSMTH